MSQWIRQVVQPNGKPNLMSDWYDEDNDETIYTIRPLENDEFFFLYSAREIEFISQPLGDGIISLPGETTQIMSPPWPFEKTAKFVLLGLAGPTNFFLSFKSSGKGFGVIGSEVSSISSLENRFADQIEAWGKVYSQDIDIVIYRCYPNPKPE